MAIPEGRPPAQFRGPQRAPPALDRDCALFLDIDGTLLEYAARPDEVRVNAELIRALPRVAAHLDHALALITGRSITGVDRLFPTLRLPIAGQHGSEHRAADGAIHHHAPDPEIFGKLQRSLEALAQRHPGLLLENKGSTLAMHYRKVPQLAAYVHRALRIVVLSLGDNSFDLQPGERMVEVRQRGLDKGTAIAEFMREPPFAGRRPVFIGDDKADEYGFAMVDRQKGWSIKVGRGKSGARYRIKDTSAVRQWLLSFVARNR